MGSERGLHLESDCTWTLLQACSCVLVDCCLHCRAERSMQMHGIIEEVVRHWSAMRIRECECKKEGERKKKMTMKERQRKTRSEEQKGWKRDKNLRGEGERIKSTQESRPYKSKLLVFEYIFQCILVSEFSFFFSFQS